MTLTKTIFRENCIKKMKNPSLHNRLYKNSLLNNKLQKKINSRKRQKILLYFPLSFEADIVKTIKKLRRKHDIYLPFMEGESFKMVPFRLPLKKKKFGIFEAGNTNRKINKIDIAIVPSVGVDGNLQRVGFGKGMYDRFFEKLNKRPSIIFIQPSLCYTKKSICDSYDIACDMLITPTKTITKKARSKKQDI